MSIKFFAEGDTLRVIDCSGEMPQGREIELFTSEEIEKLAAQRIWQSIPLKSREDMMFQTQSKSYQEWMNEDEWDQAAKALPVTATLPLAEFKA
jgi:hypothetical protein